MAKVNDYNLSFVTQEMIDLTDDMKTILNFGKYQMPVITSNTAPSWVGRQGEFVLAVVGATTRLYVCTSDLSSTSWIVLAAT